MFCFVSLHKVVLETAIHSMSHCSSVLRHNIDSGHSVSISFIQTSGLLALETEARKLQWKFKKKVSVLR